MSFKKRRTCKDCANWWKYIKFSKLSKPSKHSHSTSSSTITCWCFKVCQHFFGISPYRKYTIKNWCVLSNDFDNTPWGFNVMKYSKLKRCCRSLFMLALMCFLIYYLYGCYCLISAIISSESKTIRINPDGLLNALEIHEILDLKKTRVTHFISNDIRFYLYLRNVDFTRDDLRAVRDTISLYLKSDEFIAFVENHDRERLRLDVSLEVIIRIMEKNSDKVIVSFVRNSTARLGEDSILFSLEEGTVHYTDTREEMYLEGEHRWITRFFVDLD